MCCGSLENMILNNLVKWTSDTLVTRNLKLKTSRTKFWGYLRKCQFCQSGYVKQFTGGYPLDVQPIASWYSELKRSVASSSFSVWIVFLKLVTNLSILSYSDPECPSRWMMTVALGIMPFSPSDSYSIGKIRRDKLQVINGGELKWYLGLVLTSTMTGSWELLSCDSFKGHILRGQIVKRGCKC